MLSRTLTDGVPLLLIVLWWYFSQRLPAYVLPDPIEVVVRTWDLLGADADAFHHTYVSAVRVATAVTIALVVGTTVAVAARYVPPLRGLLIDRFSPFVNAFPSIGWAIAGLYWFGVSTQAVLFVEVAIILPFTLITVWEGLKSLDPETMEMAHSFTRSRMRVLRIVVAPFLVPYLFSALRISFGTAWKVALLAEIFGASDGLGYLLNYSREQFDSTTLFATIFTIILIVHAVDKAVFGPVERRLLRYRRVPLTRQ
ncbi:MULTISPECIES: ABC transporter permease subunit [unclassified Kribbella]|uniref:ABC transporter permease n=1 Tax=unclassified Kribbella TaxID=2644121 RepID=UPI0033F339B0